MKIPLVHCGNLGLYRSYWRDIRGRRHLWLWLWRRAIEVTW